jgi:hypothetical protein
MIAQFPESTLARRWGSLLILVVILLGVLLPAYRLGFTSDDYGNLVEASVKLPLIESVDGLHRPLRNIVFKLSYWIFGLNAAPYHLAVILLHLVAVVCLYRFILRLSASGWAAFVGAAIFGFFPRNHQILFWIAASQDSVVTICALIACTAFIHGGTKGRLKSASVALIAFSIALGFKETAIAILPLLLLVDLACRSDLALCSLRDRCKLYLPFFAVAAVYALWLGGLFGRSDVPQQFYGTQSLSQSLKLAGKFGVNMILPFSSPVEIKQVIHRPLLLAGVFVGLLLIAGAAFALVKPRKILLSAGWFIISAAPTAVLGFYTDRYLALPFIGLAMLLGFIAEGVLLHLKGHWIARLAIVFLIAVYTLESVSRLTYYRQQWGEAAEEIRVTLDETRRLYPHVPAGSVFFFVNLTHSRAAGQVYVFNTSLNGMLLAWGYDKSVTARRTFSSKEPPERQLVDKLLEDCSASPSSTLTEFVLVSKERLHAVSGDCARQAILRSLERDPQLWK